MAKGGFPVWLIIVILLVAVVAFDIGGVDSKFLHLFHKEGAAPTTPTGGGEAVTPSSGLCEFTLNTKDALTSTNTNADVTYVIFEADSGAQKKSGSTSSGTASFDLDFGKNYKIVGYLDSGSTDYYWEDEVLLEGQSAPVTTFTCDQPTLTGYMYLVGETPLNTTKLRDPNDFDSNVSLPASGTASFDVLLKTSESYKGTRYPAIIFDANTTSIDNIECGGSTISVPSRITTTSGYKKIAESLDREYIKSKDGTVVVSCSVTALSSAPATTDYLNITTMDKTFWVKAQADNIADYIEGYQNDETSSDIGVEDGGCSSDQSQAKATCQLYFNG